MVVGDGGRGNLRENREDPAPTVGIAGRSLRGIAAPTIIYAHAGIYGNGVEADNDAARRVATSFEERGNRF